MAKKKGYTGHSSEHSLNARGVKTRQFEVDVIKATGQVSPENLCHHCKKNPVGPGKILCQSCNGKLLDYFNANKPYTQRKHDYEVEWMVNHEGVENYRKKLRNNVNFLKNRADKPVIDQAEFELKWFNEKYPKKK